MMSDRELRSESAGHANRVVGQALFALGVAGVVFLPLARAGALPEFLRWRIVQHAPAWLLASLLFLGAGIALIWSLRRPGIRWQPGDAGRRFNSLVVYTRQDCPLCDEAVETLARYRPWLPAATEVDIDEDESLRSRYDHRVPVVEIDGRVRFRGRVNEVLLQRLIEATPPRPALKQR